MLPVIGLYLVYVLLLDRRRGGQVSRLLQQAIAFGLPVALSLVAVVLYNYLRFHTLLTYWRKIASPSADPLWLQPSFWRNPGWLLSGLLIIDGILLALLHFAWPRMGQARPSRWMLLATTLLLTGFALGTVVAAKADPRWHEISADPQDNVAVVEFLAQNGNRNDLVLLDLLPANDLAGRTSF